MADESYRTPNWPRTAATLLAGALAGAALMAVAVVMLMPGMMIVVEESSLGLEDTVARIQASLEEQGWSSPGTLNLNKSLSKHGVELDPQVRVVQLCHPEYARDVLAEERHVSALMPCAISVWEGDDGKVYVSKMNTGLMGKMFGGVIAEVMGGKVAKDEKAILASVVTGK